MTQHTMSLLDVLMPPVNQWLSEISRRKTKLPAGVRVVRFGDGDDDSFELQEEPAAHSATLSPPALK